MTKITVIAKHKKADKTVVTASDMCMQFIDIQDLIAYTKTATKDENDFIVKKTNEIIRIRKQDELRRTLVEEDATKVFAKQVTAKLKTLTAAQIEQLRKDLEL